MNINDLLKSGADEFVKDVFLDSDTDIMVLSFVPSTREGEPLTIEEAAETRAIVEKMDGSKRLMLHGRVNPNQPGDLADMERLKGFGVTAFKTYTQWGPGGDGFWIELSHHLLPDELLPQANALQGLVRPMKILENASLAVLPLLDSTTSTARTTLGVSPTLGGVNAASGDKIEPACTARHVQSCRRMSVFDRLLVATDFSQPSLRAVDAAAELARVVSALERLEGDEFGYCEICGEAIAPARLEHNPAVTSCIGCAR